MNDSDIHSEVRRKKGAPATEADHYLKTELYGLVQHDPHIFNFLQDGSLDGIWYWDLEHPEEEWISDRFWEVLGFNPEEMPHRADAWQELIYHEDLDTAIDNFKKHCADPGHPYDQVVRYRHKDGSTVWVRCRGIAIRDNEGTPKRLLGAHTDITDLKKTEQELEQRKGELEAINLQLLAASALKSQFLANMSHELRTPLNSVIGFAGILMKNRDGNLTDRDLDRLEKIHRSGHHLLTLINDILDLSAIEAGKLEIVQESVNPVLLLSHVVDSFRASAEERSIDLSVEVVGPQNQMIQSDERRLSQILINVIGNAVKFVRPDTGVIRTLVEISASEVHFVVTDNGIGIAPEHLDKIFDPFHQQDGGITRQFGGTGLGLAISKKFAEAMGGSIRVDSQVGIGSTFRIALPVRIG